MPGNIDELTRTAVWNQPAQTDVDDLTGQTVAGRYRLIEILGQGGMGYVYRAEHIEIGKACAIKVLAARYAWEDEQRKRFLREARAASTIAHENVVDVTDFGGTPNGSVFLAMELLNGEELSDTLQREGPLQWRRAKTIILQIIRALHAAHDKGIYHRDVKPENCFRIRRGGNQDFIKVLDFGIAKILGNALNPEQSLSQAGTVFGTPEYMSPEQARGQKVDHRTDIYATGILLYEMMTGQPPFSGGSNLEVLAKQANEAPRPPTQVAPQMSIPPEVEALMLQAIAKDPDHRFQSMRHFAEAVAAIPVHDSLPPGVRLSSPGMPAHNTGAGQPQARSRERMYITIIALLGVAILILVGTIIGLASQ